jgi:hypothetical protein
MLKTDHTSSLKLRKRKRTGCCSRNVLGLCSGSTLFESRQRHRLFQEVFRGFPQFLQEHAGTVLPDYATTATSFQILLNSSMTINSSL